MAIMAMDTKVKQLVVVLSACFFTFSSIAGDWQLKSSLKLDETYSDNLELSQTDKTTGLVSQLGVNLGADYKAQNASFTFSSTSTQAFYSHNHDLDKTYNEIEADTRILLWPNGLTFTASAAVTNQARNNSQNALASIISADLVQTERYQAGLEYDINNSRYSLNSSADYQISEAEDRLGENKGSNFSLTSSNGIAERHIFWDGSARYNERKRNDRNSKQRSIEVKIGIITSYKLIPFIRYYDEDNSGNISNNNGFETNSYGLGFRWQVKPRLFIDLSYNEPIDNSDSTNSQTDAYLDLLINWQPTSRTKLLLSHSERFYGDSYGLNLSHRNRRLTNTISYNEQVQSFSRDNYQVVSSTFICQNPDAIDLSDCFIQNGDVFNPEDISLITINSLELVEDNDYWLNKRLQWSSVLTLPRTSFSLKINHSDRENLNSGSSNTTKSASLGANRKLSPSSSFGLQASYDERGYGQSSTNPNGQTDKYRRYGINFKKSLNHALDFTLDLDRINRT